MIQAITDLIELLGTADTLVHNDVFNVVDVLAVLKEIASFIGVVFA
jgi:hypothetical protein